MLLIWLDYGGTLLETFLPNFLWKFRMCFFQNQPLYWIYLRNGWSDWCETKRRCISWILGKLCKLDLWPHPWPWPWIFFKVKFQNSCISGIVIWLMWKKRKSISIRYWDYMVLPFDHTHDLDLVVSRSKFEISLFEKWEGWLTWNEGMWVDHSWPWPWSMGNHGGWVDVPHSDWGDFRRRRVIDISSWLMLQCHAPVYNA